MIKERGKAEIEARLKGMGDYVKMDYLQRAMKSNIGFETKKFVQLRLAKIYESRNMFTEAGRLVKHSAGINTTYKGKIQDYMKAVELFIRAGNFEEADDVFNRALACGNTKEKSEIKQSLKGLYGAQAEYFLKQDKRNQAKRTYEKMMSLDLSDSEKENVKKKLLALYESLGLIRELMKLKES